MKEILKHCLIAISIVLIIVAFIFLPYEIAFQVIPERYTEDMNLIQVLGLWSLGFFALVTISMIAFCIFGLWMKLYELFSKLIK